MQFKAWLILYENSQNTALIVVDVQNDFVTGGSLAVPAGQEVVPHINHLASQIRQNGGIVVYTADLHPADHMSFKSQGGPWPAHCVVNTFGSQFVPDLDVNGPIFDKATEKDKDSYSGFGGQLRTAKTTLEAYLREHQITDVVVAGLALDYCILATATDAKKLGFNTSVYIPGTRAVNPAEADKVTQKMQQQGIKLVS